MTIYDLTSSIFDIPIQNKEIEIAFIFLILATVLPFILAFHLRYIEYLSLGPGGTPSTFLGFLKIQLLAIFAVTDPYHVDSKTEVASSNGHLNGLSRRQGLRPEVRGIAPQRQITQKAPMNLLKKLAARIESMAVQSNNIRVGTSCIEKHGIAIFNTASSYPAKHRCKGEICHLHGSDGSMHMPLHPTDAQAVFDAGWGEKHPLARGGYFERYVPVAFVMVYAPRDESEVEIVMSIVRAAAWFVSGEGNLKEAEGRRFGKAVSAEGSSMEVESRITP